MIISQSIEPVLDPTASIEDFCNSIKNKKPSKVFVTALWETFSLNIPDVQQVVYAIDQYMIKHGIDCTWVVTKWAEPEQNWQKLACPVIFFDFFIWRAFNEIVNKKKSKVNCSWNPNADRYLFLTGNPNRINRAGLLGLLQHHDLLGRCDWSFFAHQKLKTASEDLFAKFCKDDFDSIVQRQTRSPDNIRPTMQPYSLHYGGIPYNEQIFSQALFRLISETSMTEVRPWLTEKTWITVLNRTPFVIAGDRFSCDHMRSMGFEAFDTMFDIPSYDNLSNEIDRMHAVVQHVQQWLSGNYDADIVSAAVEHNYQHFVKTAQEIQREFENQSNLDINRVIYTFDYSL